MDPTARLKFPVFNLTFLTAAFLTTTFTTAFFFLFFLETTVILALPAFTPLMYPLEDTVATFLLEVLYVTFLLPFFVWFNSYGSRDFNLFAFCDVGCFPASVVAFTFLQKPS